MRAIPIAKRAIAAKTINMAALKIGNSISTIDRATIKSPNAIFAMLEDLYLNSFTVVVVIVDVGVAVGLANPKQILSIPMTSKTRDKRSTVPEIDEPGINKITAASTVEIEPSTIWSIRNQGGVLTICISSFFSYHSVKRSYISISPVSCTLCVSTAQDNSTTTISENPPREVSHCTTRDYATNLFHAYAHRSPLF